MKRLTCWGNFYCYWKSKTEH